MRVQVDPKLCQGHARCAALAPDVFELDEHGYSTTRDVDVTPELQKEAHRASQSCPELAITVTVDAPERLA